MRPKRACGFCAFITGILFFITPLADGGEPSVRFEPTPPEIVEVMLQMADVKDTDVVYDLGSGDGRIVIAAAKEYGAHGVGIELDAGLIRRARADARVAGVEDKVEFRRENLFEADIRDATVVTLYLLPEANLRLRPKLLRDLKPGVRIISHSHDMGDWEPEEARQVRDRTNRVHRLYRWTIPPRKDAPPAASLATGG